jgi:hypothetical protein
MQSRSQSVIETVTRACFNFLTALAIQVYAFPAFFHVHPAITVNMGIGLIFMANSIAGGYVVRRLFNGIAA